MWRLRLGQLIMASGIWSLFCGLSLPQDSIPSAENRRHEQPPRKVIVGTTMTAWYGNYPGLDQRLNEMCSLIAELAQESKDKYGRSPDLVLFSEYAITAGKPGLASEVAVELDKRVLQALGEKAREHQTYVVFGGVIRQPRDQAVCLNSAVILDRSGDLVGIYSKVHPVLDRGQEKGKETLEGGILPGREFNVFDLDFGRVGLQICYDVEYPEGWQKLADKGAEIVLFPTQSPQLTRPAMYAATHEYWVVSSTFRKTASFFEPGTGLVAAQITEPKRTLVHEFDLSYLILPWSAGLRNGQAFRDAFGDRVGFRYSESEDRGVFWSNDDNTTIASMARQLNLRETPEEPQARAKLVQDRLRGRSPK